jgi:hypothetical protein
MTDDRADGDQEVREVQTDFIRNNTKRPDSSSTVVDDQAGTVRTFQELAEQWRRETRHLSSVHAIVLHPAYQQIIGLGPAAIPLILRELERKLDHWFWALGAIARESPVPGSDAGRMRIMRDRWLEWGRNRGYM